MPAAAGGRSFARMIAVEDLKKTHRATWAAGDYGAIAELIDDVPPRDLLRWVQVEPRQEVLDVAAGTGNIALRAAAAGADVIGLDLTPELFETARRRALEYGVNVDWLEGDAEQLPFEDDRFDVVVSAFGVQFAPRHEVVARELARVTAPGGQIGLVNWTPEGMIGELFKVLGRYLPTPPDYASPPPLWGNEDHVRDLFEGTGVELEFRRGYNPFRFASAEGFISFFETHYGPTLKARDRLSAEGSWDDCRAEIVAMAERRGEPEAGGLLLSSEYLVTVGRKAL
jgi:SAM-dependent methyltransferase